MRYFFTVFYCFCFYFLALPVEAKLTWQGVQDEFQAALSHADDGVSYSRIAPFGKSRLISEASGIKGKRIIILGLEVVIDKDWLLNAPQIHVKVGGNYRATVLPQFQNGGSEVDNWASQYQRHIIFPILLEGNPISDVPVHVWANLTACSEKSQKCISSPEEYQIVLPIAHSYPTNVATPLQRAMMTAAVDVDRTRVQMENNQIDDNRLKVRMIFPTEVKFVAIQSVENPFEIEHKSIKGNVYTAVLRFKNAIQLGQKIPINIKTSQGNYTANLAVAHSVIKPLSEKVSLWVMFWTGLFFLLTSSVWPILMSPHIVGRDFKAKIRRLQVGIIEAMIALGLLWGFNIPPSGWIDTPVICLMMCALIIYLSWRPFQPIWVLCLCLILLPKPFWSAIESVSLGGKIGLIIWWSCCVLIPFNILIMAEKSIVEFFKQVQQGPNLSYRIFIRLPYIILFVWLGVGVLYPVMKNQDIQIDDIKAPAVIQVAPTVCFKCAVNQISVFPFLNMPVYQVSNHSKILQKWQLGTDESALILVTPMRQEVLLPDNLSLYRLKKSIMQEL